MLDYAVYTNTAYRFTGKSYSGVWKELPKDWLEGLNIGRQVGFLRAYKCLGLFFYCDFFYGGSSSLPPPAQCTSSSFTDCPRKGPCWTLSLLFPVTLGPSQCPSPIVYLSCCVPVALQCTNPIVYLPFLWGWDTIRVDHSGPTAVPYFVPVPLGTSPL